MKSKSSQPNFKTYHQHQTTLFPPSVEDFIAEHHPVRVVNTVIDKIDIDSLIAKYSHRGTLAYNPRMMLKILVYAYLSNVYSSRKIEAATSENVHFMWLSGMQRPDHNTIARFRSGRLKGVIKEVFSQVVLLLVQSGHIDLKSIYTDGTKIEANANKYTFVWGKAIQTNRERMLERLEELWAYTEKEAKTDMESVEKPDFSDLDPEKVEETVETINRVLKKKKIDPKKRQQINYARKNYKANLIKQEAKKKVLGENRNSFSKTDHDATFMRMKDDHMMNGQLKAGYNLQFSTQNQFILHYSVHQNPTDTKTLIPHLKGFLSQLGQKPDNICADAGYGSEENYAYLEGQKITPFVKFNYFHKEQVKGEQATPRFHSSKLFYNKEEDFFVCPMGQVMNKISEKTTEMAEGHLSVKSKYQAKNCQGCPLRGGCHQSRENRIIEVNHELNKLKDKARSLLTSQEGKEHRSQRPADVEASFGNLKQNKGFTRFMLRGLDKVDIEVALLGLSINLKKVYQKAA